MGKMFLMCGMSGAGKTTFAKKFAEENGYIYLGIDDFYKDYQRIFAPNLKSPWSDPKASFEVWQDFFRVINACELDGDDVVIDTNAPTFVKRAQFIDWFPTFDEHNLIYIHADRELRWQNNKSRGRVVPDDVMKQMEKEFQAPVARWDGKAVPTDTCWDSIKVFHNINNTLIEIPCCNN